MTKTEKTPGRKSVGLAGPRPIFIHALFRTGSTYIWNKFRRLPDHVCYYEPFHQLLGAVTVDNIQDILTRNFKAAGHPELDRHYLQEYEALLRPGIPGVPFFRKELSFDWFCQAGVEARGEQKKFVDFLIQACGSRVPLFQFNRTALRSAWFKSAYPRSLNVYLYRDPRDQWQSYAALRARTGYDVFFLMDLIALSKNREHPFIRPLWETLPLLKFSALEHADEEAFYRVLSQAYGEQEKYFIFYYLWLLALLENAAHADTLWDINALAEDPVYRDTVQKWLRKRRAGTLEFSDCHITRYFAFPLPVDDMEKIERKVQQRIAAIWPSVASRKIAGRLPTAIASKLRGFKAKTIIQSHQSPKDGPGGDWMKLVERMMNWLADDWRQKMRDFKDLKSALAKEEAVIRRLQNELLVREQKVVDLTSTLTKEKERNVETLAAALAQNEISLGRLQNDLQEKECRIVDLQGALQDKTASISVLQSQVAIMQNSHSFRLGRIMLFPLRMGKKLFGSLKGRGTERGLSPSEKASLAVMSPCGERKVALAEQLRLDFGHHRSGLKYGLRFLLGLHHPQGVLLDAFIERTFSWQPQGNHFHGKPWIGFIHVPPGLPEWFHPEQSNAAVFASESWRKSLPFCRGLFAFSRYHQRHLAEQLPVPVETLRLPSETPDLKWSPEAFAANPGKMIVQVGWWLRRLHAIHQFPKTDFKKAFLDVGHPSLPALLAKEKEVLVREGAFAQVDLDSVLTIPCLSNPEYDRLLSRNIVFMFLYDASACNAIVECMVRQTPLLVNPLAAVVEYLGEEYPFYFHTLPEAAAKLMDRDLILRTHDYLRRLPRVCELSGEGFLSAFSASSIYRSLAVPVER